MQCHLGDVFGDPMPMVKRRRYGHAPRWIENGTSAVIGVVGVVVFALLILAFVVLSLLLVAKPAAAQVIEKQVTEKQVREDCTRDAVRYCTVEALACLKQETPQCRQAVIACMLEHKAKLRAKCSRHFY